MHKIKYNEKNQNWYSCVTVKDVTCYFDQEGRIHRLDGPAICPSNQWFYKDINLTDLFEDFCKKTNSELNSDSFKIFIFEWKIKMT